MLSYRPGDSLAHRLDPRTKLAVQIAFAAAAFAHTTLEGLAALTVLAAGMLATARTPPIPTLWAYRFALPLLLVGPVLEGLTWIGFDPAAAFGTALASYRVLLILLVSAAYVQTTPVRASRAAIQRVVPGRAGQFLGMGVAFVFRFLPLLRADIGRIRDAVAARLGTERPVHERMALVTVAGLDRALARADRLSLALRARCFAWNPTLPALSFARLDLAVLVLAAGLGLAAVY